jgi:hypothetical protein
MVCLLLLLFPVTCSLSPLYAQGSTPTRFNLGGFNDLKKIPKPTQYPDANHTRIYAKTGTDTVCVENNLGTEVCFAGISGTTNYLPKFTGATTLGDSLLSDDGTTLTYAGTGGISVASLTATSEKPSSITPAAVPGSPVAGDWGILAGSPDLFWFFNDTAVQYALTKPADLFGSSPAGLLVTKAAGADPTTDNCVKWLAGGGVGDAGAACGIGTKSIWIDTPVVADSGRIQFMFPVAVTITRVACSTKLATSTVDLNMEERAAATPDTAGTDVLSAELVCDTNQQTSCASGCDVNTITNGGIAARVPVAITPSAIANAPTDLRIFIEYY